MLGDDHGKIAESTELDKITLRTKENFFCKMNKKNEDALLKCKNLRYSRIDIIFNVLFRDKSVQNRKREIERKRPKRTNKTIEKEEFSKAM